MFLTLTCRVVVSRFPADEREIERRSPLSSIIYSFGILRLHDRPWKFDRKAIHIFFSRYLCYVLRVTTRFFYTPASCVRSCRRSHLTRPCSANRFRVDREKESLEYVFVLFYLHAPYGNSNGIRVVKIKIFNGRY